jgi:hypothetical protein
MPSIVDEKKESDETRTEQEKEIDRAGKEKKNARVE